MTAQPQRSPSAPEPLHAGQAPGTKDRRIPSLDGLRAVSIFLVLLAHASGTAGFPRLVRSAILPFGLGNLGVRVFFVISGFLITGLLLQEHARSGRIALGRFYLRRTLRIFPPYYAYLAVLLAVSAAGWLPPVPRGALLHALTYTVNYTDIGTWMTAHFWSLSVEEQFYLLWPPVLVWFGLRGGMRAAVVFVLASPFVRLGLYLFVPASRIYAGTAFHAVADAIVAGCLLARWRGELWRRGWYRRLLTSRWMVLVPAVVIAAAMIDGRPRISYFVGITVKNIGIALIVDWAVRFPGSRLGRMLNARWVTFVGVLSYSLYVWQQPFLAHAYVAPWLRFPFNAVYTLAAACASYYLIERPSLSARARIERRLYAGRGAQGTGALEARQLGPMAGQRAEPRASEGAIS